MSACLSDQDLAAYVDGSASAEQMSACKQHLSMCDACAGRAFRLQGHIGQPAAPDPHKPEPTPVPTGTLTSGTRLGDFEIEKRIGSGGMGVVYQARQISLNRRVALKVLPPGLGMTSSAVVRFHREAQAAAKLHHTNIVAVYAEGDHDGTCFYAMELIEGKGLDQIIAEWKDPTATVVGSSDPTMTLGASPPPATVPTPSGSSTARTGTRPTREHFDTISKWVADAADALDYAHKQGVIHRDIKPSNLMLADDGRVTVMDFGLARMLEEPGMTVSGEFLGTPRYMSPEQIAVGRAKLDHRTDIYSLGATLYELLTLQPPFPGEHRDEIIAAIMAKEPVRPRRIDRCVPLDLETICLKAIEKDPDRRYQTSAGLADDLRRYLDRQPIQAKHAGAASRLGKLIRRHRVPVAGTAAGVILATLIATLVAWGLWPEPPVVAPKLTNYVPITQEDGVTAEPSLTPNGHWLVYASDREGGTNLDLWLQELDGGRPVGDPERLTTDPADDRQPSISPNGKQIAFRSDRSGGGIYIISVAEKTTKLIARKGHSPRFSPDGKWIAYWEGKPGAGINGQSFVMTTEGKNRKRLLSQFSAAQYPIWSPKGDELLFRGQVDGIDPKSADWWIVPFADPGNPSELIHTLVRERIREYGIDRLPVPHAWASGDHVFFSAVAKGQTSLWMLSLSPDTGRVDGPFQKLSAPTSDKHLQPWPIGENQLLFTARDDNSDILYLPIDPATGAVPKGASLQQLTTNPAEDSRPRVSDDGKKVVFESTRSTVRRIWVKDLVTGKVEPLSQDVEEAQVNPFFTSPTATQVAYQRPGEAAIRIVDVRNADIRYRIELWSYFEDSAFPLDWSYQWTVDTDAHVEHGVIRWANYGRNRWARATAAIIDNNTKKANLNDRGLQRGFIESVDEFLFGDVRLSPDGKRVLFNAIGDPTQSQIFVTAYKPGMQQRKADWLPLSRPEHWADKPRWSRDGKRIYFVSDRDGDLSIYTRSSDPHVWQTTKIRGFQEPRLRMTNLDLRSLELSVAQDKIVFNLGRRKSNIWMAQLTEE